jgi:hypothetical protein
MQNIMQGYKVQAVHMMDHGFTGSNMNKYIQNQVTNKKSSPLNGRFPFCNLCTDNRKLIRFVF